jgi:hypothetical protein
VVPNGTDELVSIAMALSEDEKPETVVAVPAIEELADWT